MSILSRIDRARRALLAPEKPTRRAHRDAWENALTGLGYSGRDKRLSSEFAASHAVTLSSTVLDYMYAGDDIIANIVDIPADEMTREWFELDTDDPRGEQVMQRAEELGAQRWFAEGLVFGPLYGGAGLIIGIEDGQDPASPVGQVRRVSYLGPVLDRWSLRTPDAVYDASQVTAYEIQTSNAGALPFGQRIHPSRVLRFDGVLTPMRLRDTNGGWGLGIVQRVYEVVRDFAAAFGGSALTLQGFSQGVYTLRGLSEALAADADDTVYERLQAMDYGRSVVRGIVLGDGDTYQQIGASVSGQPELLDRMISRIAMAVRMPQALLMGQAPAGLNATGESDIRFWYDRVRGRQARELAPPLRTLLRYLWAEAGGEPEKWGIVFKPLWQPTEKEQAETHATQAQADQTYVDMGADERDVLRSRFGGGKYSLATTLDVTKLEDEPDLPNITGAPEGVEAETVANAVPPESALNGAQVASMLEVLRAVAAGQLPRASAVQLLTVAFPVDVATAERLLGSIGQGFVPSEVAPATEPRP